MENRIRIGILALVLALGLTGGARADDAFATNRFFGGSFDGFDVAAYLQTDTSVYPMIYARFKGGNASGWQSGAITGVRVQKGRVGGMVKVF